MNGLHDLLATIKKIEEADATQTYPQGNRGNGMNIPAANNPPAPPADPQRAQYDQFQSDDKKKAAIADVKKIASTPLNNISRFGVAIDPKSGQIFYGDAGDEGGTIRPKGYPFKWMQPGGPAESVKDGDRIRASGLEITDKGGYAYVDPAKLATIDQAPVQPVQPVKPTAPTVDQKSIDDNPGLTRFRTLINKAQGIAAESVVFKSLIGRTLMAEAFDPAVQKLQQELIAKGAKIKADGIMGPATKAAQAQFPASNNPGGMQGPTSAGTMYGSLTADEVAEGDKLFQSYGDSEDPEIMNLLKQWMQIKNSMLNNNKPPVNTPVKPPAVTIDQKVKPLGWEANQGQNTAGGAGVGNPSITAQGKKSGATQVPDVPIQQASGYKLTPQEAQNVLANGQPNDIARYGGKAALQKLAAQDYAGLDPKYVINSRTRLVHAPTGISREVKPSEIPLINSWIKAVKNGTDKLENVPPVYADLVKKQLAIKESGFANEELNRIVSLVHHR
jgi:hypothetical protein